jgi:hypothetical protein
MPCAVQKSGFYPVETFFFHKVQRIVIKDQTHDSPHIVLEVGIIKVHAPTLRGGGKLPGKGSGPRAAEKVPEDAASIMKRV